MKFRMKGIFIVSMIHSKFLLQFGGYFDFKMNIILLKDESNQENAFFCFELFLFTNIQ